MAAPKGNKFAIGNKGREKEFNTPEELQSYVDSYFKSEDDNPVLIYHTQLDRKTNKPVAIEVKRPYTVEGLSLWLGLTRQSLLNYEKTEGYKEYFNIIRDAKEKIRRSYIEGAMVGAYKERFTEFVLTNNSDYESSKKIDHGSSDGTMSPKSNIIVVDKETKDELESLENEND